MARYIDIEGAGIGRANREQFLVPEFADGWNAVLKILDKEPTADVVEVKHGEWKQGLCFDRFYYCSECNRRIEDATKRPYEHFPYCHCGAKMGGRSDT